MLSGQVTQGHEFNAQAEIAPSNWFDGGSTKRVKENGSGGK